MYNKLQDLMGITIGCKYNHHMKYLLLKLY